MRSQKCPSWEGVHFKEVILKGLLTTRAKSRVRLKEVIPFNGMSTLERFHCICIIGTVITSSSFKL